ncbi:hypothetical protein D3C71_1284850 [compost metagenome]
MQVGQLNVGQQVRLVDFALHLLRLAVHAGHGLGGFIDHRAKSIGDLALLRNRLFGLADFLLDGRGFLDDFPGSLSGFFRQQPHFTGHHCEAAPGVTGTRRFDGGVERQQVGLACDVADQVDDAVDLTGAAYQVRDHLFQRLQPGGHDPRLLL